MGEVAGAGEVHRDARGCGGLDRELVTHRTPGLDDGADPGVDEDQQLLAELDLRPQQPFANEESKAMACLA